MDENKIDGQVWVEVDAANAIAAGKSRWGWMPISVAEIQALLTSDQERAAFARQLVRGGVGLYGPGGGQMVLNAFDGATRLYRYVEATPSEAVEMIRAFLAKKREDAEKVRDDEACRVEQEKRDVASVIDKLAKFPTGPCMGWEHGGSRVFASEHATDEQKREVESLYVTVLTSHEPGSCEAREARRCADGMWPEGHLAIKIYDERLAAVVAKQVQEIAAENARRDAAKQALLAWASERDADIRAASAEGYDCDAAADAVVVTALKNAVRRLWDPRTLEGERIGWIDVEGELVERKERRAPSRAILSRRAIVAKALAEVEFPSGYEVAVSRVQRLEWVEGDDEDEFETRKVTGVMIELRSARDERAFPVSLEA